MISTLYEPFRHWSEGGSIFILSDTHFDDADCKMIDPNWISPEKQLEIINSVVSKGDTFVCLGDVGDPKYVPMIKARKKILIIGNHDARGSYKDLFSEIYAGPLIISDKILLSHEPVYGLSWCLNIHGHDHSGMEDYKDGFKHINLAANVCGYTPVSLGKIIKDGVLSDIESIHRITINKAIEKKKDRRSGTKKHLYRVNPFCPYCKEEHGYYDIGLTSEEQLKLDQYYIKKESEKMSDISLSITEMHEPPLLVKRKFVCCVCGETFEKTVVVSKFLELGRLNS